jgi:hypothetical protein
MARIAVKVAADVVKAKVVANPLHVRVGQVVRVAHRVPVEQASQAVRLSQQVQVVVQCHRVRSIVPVGAVAK